MVFLGLILGFLKVFEIGFLFLGSVFLDLMLKKN